MFFRQVLHDDLGCASYVIADAGEAVVIDPKWQIEDYLRLATDEGFRIVHILETHTHADHVSGRGRLVEATGAAVHVSRDAEVEFPHEPLEDGAVIEIGKTRIVAVATPGHRPDHTSFLVTDTSRSSERPWLVATGDSLFVGDVARPDLAVEEEEGARDLFRSLRRLLELEDDVELCPAHVGGSLCGGAGMSEKPLSTIGFERRFNRYLQIEDEGKFVEALTETLAPQPPNFERIVELNRGPLLTQATHLEPLAPERVQALLREDAILLDGRAPREYDAAHVPGSINVTMVKAAVGTRAGWVVDPERPVIVTAADPESARRMGRMLEAVGFRRLLGYLEGGMPAWQPAGLEVETTEAIDTETLAEGLRSGDLELLDVREEDEWRAGHVPDSLHLPYHELRDGIPEELRGRDGTPLAVACSAGVRSSIAVSLLRRQGLDRVKHVVPGGVPDLAEHGIELAEAAG